MYNIFLSKNKYIQLFIEVCTYSSKFTCHYFCEMMKLNTDLLLIMMIDNLYQAHL